ncbi:MAG TPA: DUF2497 domain-containing protein [Caulobacteraceae bacterium]
MSDQAAPEPTMEEILASIRRIISEDDAPGADDAKADDSQWRPPPPATERQTLATDERDLEDEVLELTERVTSGPASPAETHGDVEVYSRDDAGHSEPMAEPMTEPEPAEPPASATASPPPFAPPAPESLVAPEAAQQSASAFGRLTAALTKPEPMPAPAPRPDGRTLEDVAREVLRPLLKDWLDQNLPRIVQARVDEEVERIARRQVR